MHLEFDLQQYNIKKPRVLFLELNISRTLYIFRKSQVYSVFIEHERVTNVWPYLLLLHEINFTNRWTS